MANRAQPPVNVTRYCEKNTWNPRRSAGKPASLLGVCQNRDLMEWPSLDMTWQVAVAYFGLATGLEAPRTPECWRSQDFWQSTPEVGKVVSLITDRIYPPPPTSPPPSKEETSLVLIYVRGWIDPRAIVRPEGLGQRKISHTISGYIYTYI
jgi:hypothetical protein